MSKDALRREARQRLRAMAPEARIAAADAVARRVWSVPEVASARTLLLYASLPEEVDTDAIAREALRRGVALAYPRCLPATRHMVLHRLHGLEELRDSGSYGIREPETSCPVLSPDEVDVALVPGLAWDRTGTRLGRGAGYYDRLFEQPGWRAFRCGLFFSVQELGGLPRDPWDAPLHAVVTERETVRIGADRWSS